MGRYKRTNCKPVKSNQYYEDFLHKPANRLQCCSNDLNNSLLQTFFVSGLAITTKSAVDKLCWWWRKLSRITRFIRFRSTACLAFFFDIAKPKRGSAFRVWLGDANIVNKRSLERSGFLKTRLYSAGFKSLTRRGKRAPIFTILSSLAAKN